MPLKAIVTGANVHDSTQLIPLIDTIPPIRGKRGAPVFRPKAVVADKAYTSMLHHMCLWARGIEPLLPERGTNEDRGLGVLRWVVERTISWLHQMRRLRTRYERRSDIHEAFLTLGCIRICYNALKRSF